MGEEALGDFSLLVSIRCRDLGKLTEKPFRMKSFRAGKAGGKAQHIY